MRTKIESIARRAEKDIIKGYDIQARIEMAIKQALTQDLEPVAWVWINKKGVLNYGETPHDMFESSPLYIAPPQRKPLTDEEIDHIYTGVRAVHHEIDSYVFARAIEAAHGIKENT